MKDYYQERHWRRKLKGGKAMMIKRKGAGTVLGIILISASGWVALVTFVLADNLLVGAALSLAGGIAIGVAVAFLLRRWWFKGIRTR